MDARAIIAAKRDGKKVAKKKVVKKKVRKKAAGEKATLFEG